ncbi:anti-sigma factor [Nocardia thailandica]
MTETPLSSIAARQARVTRTAVEVPAEVGQLLTLRALADTVSMIAGLSLDETTDIRVSIDEVATCLSRQSLPETMLRCAFDTDREQVVVRITAVTVVEHPIDESGLSWQLLVATSDRIERRVRPAADGYEVEVTLTHHRRHRG